MQSMSQIVVASALLLTATGGSALGQWLVTPPTPPSEWRPVEIPRQPPPQDPGATGQALPGAPANNNGDGGNAVEQPNTGCPYQERKLELLV